MATRPDEPPFTLSVQAGFAEDGVWTIDARLQFPDGKTPSIESRLLGEGRIALLAAIHREGLRGRSLGATRVRVAVDAPVKLTPFDVIPDAARSTEKAWISADPRPTANVGRFFGLLGRRSGFIDHVLSHST